MKVYSINIIALSFLILCVFSLRGQNIDHYNNTFKIVKSKTIVSDSFTIIPSYVTINLEDSISLKINKDYTIENTKIILSEKTFRELQGKKLSITYKTLDINLGKKYYHLDSIALVNSEKAAYIGYDLGKNQNLNNELLPSGLDYDGSFSRGFSVGNNQSLVLNSNLNLQMQGDIGSGIKINASISDANIPIQPEGTTQRLNEFDKVFIEVSKDDNSLVAGDFEIGNPNGYFTRYYKKLKGIKYSNKLKFKKKNILKNSFGFAISKGKFSRNTLKVSNGNQGPYKLSGSEGERFLIILSGTEKVYLDGRLLTRGWDNDYTIDYNLAEITFTPKIMITENSRIIVEFEYSDQNYLRSLQVANSIYGDSTRNFYFNFYNEMDSKTSQGLIELDSSDIDILTKSGDDILNNVRTGIRPISTTNEIESKNYYYKKYESSIADSILVFTSNPDSAKYLVYFSEVGENLGSYDIDLTNINGRVYRWVGYNQGKYAPVIRLIPPEKKQMISLGGKYRLNKMTYVTAEMSLSNLDKNRYSPIDDNDNTGFASLINLHTAKEFKSKKNILSFKNDIKYEFTDKRFNPLNPYRPPEFSRDWNILKNDYSANENLINNKFSFKLNNLDIAYDYSGYFKGDYFTGNKHVPSLNFNHKGFSLFAEGNLLNTQSENFSTRFFRPKINISQRLAFLRNTNIGINFEQEKNEIKDKNDSITSSSFYFDNIKLFLNNSSSKAFSINLYFGNRNDYLPNNNEFKKYTSALESGLTGKWLYKNVSDLSFNIAFRNLTIKNDISDIKKPGSNLLGKLQHRLNLLKGGIRSVTNMEFGSGQLAKADFVFVKVKPGEGSYVWIDYNKNSIEEKDEFEVIPGIDTANYVKIIQYNNEFLRTNSSMINNSFRVEGSKFLSKDTTLSAKLIHKLSFASIFRMTQKTQSGEDQNFEPIVFSLEDTSLISYNFVYSGTVFFNKGNPLYDIRAGYKINSNKPIQIDGYTRLGLKEYFLASRYNYIDNLDLLTKISKGAKWYESQSYLTKNYYIDYLSVSEEMNIFFNRKFGLKLNYNFNNKNNTKGQLEKAIIHQFEISAKLLNFKNIKILTSLSLVNIDFNGSQNTPVELAMLEGLKNGNNYLWSLKASKRLKNNLDLILQYDGRKTGVAKTIHTAKIQARAVF